MLSQDALTAAVLGLVEGLTEFLPVSSTGHLIVLGDLFGFGGSVSKVFEVVIQLGAILAVCWLYRAKLWHTVATLGREAGSRRFATNLVLAVLPAVVLGFLLHGVIKRVLFSPSVVAWAFIAGGLVILIVERYRPQTSVRSVDELSGASAVKIGFFQCLAMVPGTSRSGATIVGALLLGVSREAATEFSFFLAIPTMFGATVLDLYTARHELSGGDLDLIAIGFAVAFVSALFVVRRLIGFVSRHGFAPFAWYRIAAGLAMLLFMRYGH